MNDLTPVGFECYDEYMIGFNTAKKYGLEAEFIEWMFKSLNINKDQVAIAVAGSLMEWDI